MKSELLEDFSLTPVPPERRRHWISVAMVWIGVAIVMSAILRGMMVGMGLGSFKSLVIAYLLGEVMLIVMMGLTGFIGAKVGLSTPLVARAPFGSVGSQIISLCLAGSSIGWFGVQAGLFAETVNAYTETQVPVPYIAFTAGIVMMSTAVFGFRGLKMLSWVSVPLMLIVLIVAMIKIGQNFLPPHVLVNLAKNHHPDPYPLTIGGAASLVAGGFIVGAVTSPDVYRYARRRVRDVFYAATLAMGVSALMHVVGSVLTMSTGEYHERLPFLIISPQYLGLGLIGFVILALAQWTSNDNNLYSAVLALNNIIRWDKWKLTIVAGVVSSLLAAAGILGRIELFLTLLTVGIGPIGGIIIAHYYLLKRHHKEHGQWGEARACNYKALMVYFVSFGIGWITSGHPYTIKIFPFSAFAFNGIVSSMLLYYVVMKLERRGKKEV